MTGKIQVRINQFQSSSCCLAASCEPIRSSG